MTTATLIKNVRPWAGEPSDIVIEGGRIAKVVPAGNATPDADGSVIDGRGHIALPSFTDTHAHLDSTRLGLPFRPHTAGPGLEGLIENDRANWRSAEESVSERATYTLDRTIASGATTVRSHAQVDTLSGLDRIEGVLAARAAHQARATVQVVAFPQAGIIRDRGTADLLAAALSSGADLVGGIDPCGLDRNPVEHLDTVFGLAERHQVGVDLHLHETGELGAFTLDLIFDRVRALAMHGMVTVSHAFALATLTPDRVEAIASQLAELDIALTTIAPAGRRTLPLDLLARHAVRVGLGQDGMRDYWSPFGDGDMLGRTWQLAFVSQLRRDDLIERCVAVATVGGRAIVEGGGGAAWTANSEEPRGLAPGDCADLVLIAGETVTSAVMDRPPSRIVVRRDRVVAEDGVLV
ncbi:amidohydrolase [Micromonospora sp. CB01531]|uniref:amidohydrolase n=1 Tax=Micromonospora sp. CB01531 TaxID=1718947 RepID=UPI0009F98435|nr:amidohydrolase [Micromonospora sp. CB01531]